MDSKIEIALFALGVMYVLFTIGRLINIFCLYREDSGQSGAIDGILSLIAVLLMLAGLPVFGIHMLTARFDMDRAEERGKARQKVLDDMMIPGERKDAYSKGYEAGYRDGKISAGFPEKTKKTPEP